MRTAQSIEQNKAISENKGVIGSSKPEKRLKIGKPGNPNIATAGKATQFKPGNCANPGGRPKHDLAAQLAREVFEKGYPAAMEGLLKAMAKGNAYTFKELADRAYGKLTERQEHTFKQDADGTLDERIQQLERDLGYAATIDAVEVEDTKQLVAHESHESDDAAK